MVNKKQVDAVGAAPEVCERVKQLIDELREELFVALTLDIFIIYLNDPWRPKLTRDDVKTCLRYDNRIKIVNVGGKEIVWLWNDDLQEFVSRVTSMASIYGEAVVISEC